MKKDRKYQPSLSVFQHLHITNGTELFLGETQIRAQAVSVARNTVTKKVVKLIWFLVLNGKKRIEGTPILKLAMVKRLQVKKFVKNLSKICQKNSSKELSKKMVKRFVKKICQKNNFFLERRKRELSQLTQRPKRWPKNSSNWSDFWF